MNGSVLPYSSVLISHNIYITAIFFCLVLRVLKSLSFMDMKMLFCWKTLFDMCGNRFDQIYRNSLHFRWLIANLAILNWENLQFENSQGLFLKHIINLCSSFTVIYPFTDISFQTILQAEFYRQIYSILKSLTRTSEYSSRSCLSSKTLSQWISLRP